MTIPSVEDAPDGRTRFRAPRRGAMAIAVLAGLATLPAPGLTQPTGPVAPAAFQARTVADLASLCGARAGDAHAGSAVHLCHGFLIGVGQYHAALYPPGEARSPLFCPPSPPPTVAQVAAGFTAWAQANPQYGAERAVDGLARFAQATYPCPVAAPASASRVTRTR